MLERWPLPTHLLAAFAAWSLAVLLVALAGLGGTVELHPDDPALAPALPQIERGDTAPALEPIATYAEVHERPLFSPDRRPQSVQLAATAEAGTEGLLLTSVILTPQLRMALLRDGPEGPTLRVREGETLPGRPSWRLVEISPREAVIEGGDGRRQLLLRVFDGKGGENPTPTSHGTRQANVSPQAPAAAPAAPANANVTANEAPLSRAEEIRRRIEARRTQLREAAAKRSPAQEE